MNVGFREGATRYESGSQTARVWSEGWVQDNLFCPNCGSVSLEKFRNNQPVADFGCRDCNEQFELKAQKTAFGQKVVDGAFRTMIERLAAADNPNLLLMRYDGASRAVRDLFVVPKHFFTSNIIEPRKPLGPNARRAGWQGCNILLSQVPQAGRIWLVRDSLLLSRQAILDDWRNTLFLREQAPGSRGWAIEVLKCVEAVGRAEFSLDEVYAFEGVLRRLYPGNSNIRPKIRQQLQVLRDHRMLEFLGGGRYRRTYGGNATPLKGG